MNRGGVETVGAKPRAESLPRPGAAGGSTRSPRIAAVGRALPEHWYDQATLSAALRRALGVERLEARRLDQLHRNMHVEGRHLALPMEAYRKLDGFTASNDAFIRCGLELGARAVEDALGRAGLAPEDVDHLFFVSVTGIATPSLDAGMANRLGMRSDVKRTPIFGLGCVAGAAGVARAADYLRAFPDQVAVLVSVELCSLTLQMDDVSVANIIGSGLFGDGAAAVVLTGADVERSPAARPLAPPPAPGPELRASAPRPEIVATRSVLYPHTEDVMGWKIGGDGFRIVLSPDVPDVVEKHVQRDVDAFLGDHGLTRGDVATWIAHPGGPKILEAMERALALPDDALERTWRSLAAIGNLSSASVLLVLQDTLDEGRPEPDTPALMLAMGPGFCAELVLLRA